MKKTTRIIFVICFCLVGCKQENQKESLSKGPFEPTIESLSQFEIPEWIQDAKLGFWAHWGPQAQAAQGDWYARGMYIPGKGGRYHYEHHVKTYGHPSEFGFKDVIAQWKAEKFDEAYADSLMKLFKKAGSDFFVAQAHHHDNFDNWDSKYHEWNAVDMGPRKNIMKIWEDAARNNGLRLGITSHLENSPDWWSCNKNADKSGPYAGIPYDGADPEYSELYHPVDWESEEYNWEYRWYQRVSDVIEQHNPDFMYVDGGIPFKDSYGLQLLANYYNQNYLANGNQLEAFILSKRLEDVEFSIYDMEYSFITKQLPRLWFDDALIGHWFWNEKFEEGNIMYGSSNYQIDHLIDVVSKNGVVMMVVPQRGDGSIHDELTQMLVEMGEWMEVNSEGIRGTRPFRVYGEGPSPIPEAKVAELENGIFRGGRDNVFRTHFGDHMAYTADMIRYTTSKDGKFVYAFLLGWPEDLTEVKMKSLGLYQLTVNSVELLGSGEKISWVQDDNYLTVQLPSKAPFVQAVCFKLSVSY